MSPGRECPRRPLFRRGVCRAGLVYRAVSDGSIVQPWQLQDALTAWRIKPGHTLYLRGGVYSGAFVSTLVGVMVRPYQDEQPIIDGSLIVNGADSTYQDLEIRYSGWATRVSTQTGSAPTDIPNETGLDIYGARTTVKRCVIHDVAGIGFWESAIDSAMEECLIYNQGWGAPDRGHGHSLYSQNATGTKTIRRCVFGGGYSDYSMHAYTESGGIQGFTMTENISIGKTFLIGGKTPVDRLLLERSILWGGGLQLGYGAAVQNGSAALADNILANGVARGIFGTWAALSETGTDTATGNRILVYGRNVVVFNQGQAASVPAPLAGRYTNAQNPVETVALEAGAALPMTGWTVAVPIGASAPLTPSTFPQFGCFLVTYYWG